MNFSLKNFHYTQNDKRFLRKYYLPIIFYVANIWHTREIDEIIVTQSKIFASENNSNYSILSRHY